MDPLQLIIPATERWLQLTGQTVNVGKATSFQDGLDDPAPLLSLGAPIPRLSEIKRLGVGIEWAPEGGRPTLEGRGKQSETEALCQRPPP